MGIFAANYWEKEKSKDWLAERVGFKPSEEP
jgi:hypothetical protein